jgi:transcriptional regulator with XRE-family HTH domain
MVGKQKITPAEGFGIALRKLRKSAGLSQEELALEAGIQRNFVSLIELGRNQPSVTTIFKLADALSIKPSKLVQLADDELTKKI